MRQATPPKRAGPRRSPAVLPERLPKRCGLDLREHLEQLRVLYEQTGRPEPGGTGNGAVSLFGQDAARKAIESSPESFGRFLARVIKEKKRRIEAELDLL